MKYSSAKMDNSGESSLLQRPVFSVILIIVMQSFSKTHNTCLAFLPPTQPPARSYRWTVDSAESFPLELSTLSYSHHMTFGNIYPIFRVPLNRTLIYRC